MNSFTLLANVSHSSLLGAGSWLGVVAALPTQLQALEERRFLPPKAVSLARHQPEFSFLTDNACQGMTSETDWVEYYSQSQPRKRIKPSGLGKRVCTVEMATNDGKDEVRKHAARKSQVNALNISYSEATQLGLFVLVVAYEFIGFEGPEEALNALANYYAQVEALKMSEFEQYRDKDSSDVSPRQSLSSESARSSFEAVQARFKPSGLLKSNASQTDMRPSSFDVNSNSLDVQRKSSLYEHAVHVLKHLDLRILDFSPCLIVSRVFSVDQISKFTAECLQDCGVNSKEMGSGEANVSSPRKGAQKEG
jgi:hypothetical protein